MEKIDVNDLEVKEIRNKYKKLRNIIFCSDDSNMECNMEVFPTQYYLISLVGFFFSQTQKRTEFNSLKQLGIKRDDQNLMNSLILVS